MKLSQWRVCVKLYKSATEYPEVLSGAFGEPSLSLTAFFEWHSRFKAGRMSAEDGESSRRPTSSKTTENVEKIREFIHEDRRRRTLQELADTVGISYGVCQEIVTESLNMLRIAAKFVSRPLTNDQKQRRVNRYLELREKANEGPIFVSRIITGDESWIYGYESEAKQ
jgi:hypothetical protein